MYPNADPRRLTGGLKSPLLLLLLLVPSAYSQYPGQYPPGQYPPGQYPPGRYPGGQGPGLPIPRRGKTTTKEQKAAEQTHVIRGVVSAIDAKSLEVEAEDERMVTFQIVDATKKPDGLVPGDKVEVDATQDDKGVFTATSIKKTGSAPAPQEPATPAGQPVPTGQSVPKGQPSPSEQPEDTRPTTTMATPVPLDPDDEGGPPKLKRGIPKSKKPVAGTTEVARNLPPAAPPTAPASPAAAQALPETAPAPTTPSDSGHLAAIEKAKQASEDFLTGLPNYVCQQFTTRYVSEGHVTDWKAVDVVSADVIYENGKERYEHLAIDGKAVKKSIEETGAWSTGEFGTVLADLFSPATAAEFKFAGNRTIRRQPAVLYDFDVTHPHSHWKIQVPGQAIMPAYHGSVWISKDTGRVLRIEMQAAKIQVDFPDDTTEMALDYDYASLETQKYLLPAKAEILSCQRGSSMCQRNVIEFRNYHKYAGESTITFH